MDLQEFLNEWHNGSPTVLVHTSGSTGKPKPMYVEKRRMEASARITCSFLGLKPGDTALLCLPMDYIAGKMMAVRSVVCSLQTVCLEPSNHPFAASKWVGSNIHVDLAAMVPSQVWCSLQVSDECERLRAVRHLLIGGGAIDDAMADALADFPHNVWSTYGMTETLSHIALRRLNGPDRSDWYTPFDGVTVSLNADGCLVINAPAVHDGPLVTNDIAELRHPLPSERAGGEAFRILGRKDNVICSGGIKIQIEEVERLLKPHAHVPFIITKVPDPCLGEALVLLTTSTDLDALRHICTAVLPRYWRPRHFHTVPTLPITPTGKPARQQAAQLALTLLKETVL
jgi:O-succinylbenzoic acid--CoA ligase